MKLLVYSDTHGDHEAFEKMIEQNPEIDAIYSLGDNGFSEDYLKQFHVLSVIGNYPYAPRNPLVRSEKWFDKWFFFTHGHRYHVKFGLRKLRQAAHILRMDVCFFGHTHQAYLKKEENLLVINPGALSYHRSHLNPSYARIEIDDKHFLVEIINLVNQKIMTSYHEVNNE